MLQYLLYFVSAIFICIVGLCAYLLYMPFYFPKPTGSYEVGMWQYHWIDTTRQETRGHDPAHPHRELMVKAWYPAEITSAGAKATPYASALLDFDRKKNKTIREKFIALVQGEYRPTYAYLLIQGSNCTERKTFSGYYFFPRHGTPRC